MSHTTTVRPSVRNPGSYRKITTIHCSSCSEILLLSFRAIPGTCILLSTMVARSECTRGLWLVAIVAMSFPVEEASSFALVDRGVSSRRTAKGTGFVLSSGRGDVPALFSTTPTGKGDEGDFPQEEESSYESTVDWDAEWKKVVANKDQPVDRPGKDFYKSEAELAAIRAANKAASEAQKVSQSMPSLPSWDSLKSDWKVSGQRLNATVRAKNCELSSNIPLFLQYTYSVVLAGRAACH